MNDADLYLYLIVALLPLSAAMVVLQVNPFYALILRGILGAMAALAYTMLGAADVALTEALVGTLLAVMLYAVAVRSSLVMRLGVLEENAGESAPIVVSEEEAVPGKQRQFRQLIDDLRQVFSKHYMRLELIPFTNVQALQRALMEKEVHGICIPRLLVNRSVNQPVNQIGDQPLDQPLDQTQSTPYQMDIRVRRIYEILREELAASLTRLTSVNVPGDRPAAGNPAEIAPLQPGEENS